MFIAIIDTNVLTINIMMMNMIVVFLKDVHQFAFTLFNIVPCCLYLKRHVPIHIIIVYVTNYPGYQRFN